MATVNSTSMTEILDSMDLVVCIRDELGFVEYHGTRAQIEAEGIIPEGLAWPDGYDDLRWQSGKFNFWLCRRRPNGAKGPRKAFIDCDWWHIRWDVSDEAMCDVWIKVKAKELSEAIYRASPEWGALCNRAWEARQDTQFQNFKARIPGAIRTRRGRRSKEDREAVA